MTGATRTSTGRRYLWLALLPLVATVIASMALVVTANRAQPLDLLPGGDQKTGKVVTGGAHQLQDLEKLKILIDSDSVMVAGLEHIDADGLQLHLLHATQPDQDRVIVLHPTDSGFRGELAATLPARGTLLLAAETTILIHSPYLLEGDSLILGFRPPIP